MVVLTNVSNPTSVSLAGVLMAGGVLIVEFSCSVSVLLSAICIDELVLTISAASLSVTFVVMLFVELSTSLPIIPISAGVDIGLTEPSSNKLLSVSFVRSSIAVVELSPESVTTVELSL